MFSKSKIHENAPKSETQTEAPRPAAPTAPAASGAQPAPAAPSAAKPKAAPSVISTDLTLTGNLHTNGDIQVEGRIDGDIRAHLITVGESAVITGEVMADDIVVHGHVKGTVRGLKVRLTSTAKVEGDIIHKTIAIESGAHFEGSVQRAEDPLKSAVSTPKPSNG
ncbi:MAG: polymer-forming cytoskeletal protein [Pikeienuella sp.]